MTALDAGSRINTLVYGIRYISSFLDDVVVLVVCCELEREATTDEVREGDGVKTTEDGRNVV